MTAGWFLLAMFIGETGFLEELPPVAVPAVVIGSTALLLTSYAASPCLRTRVALWSDRTLVALHLVRFVGIYFLILTSRGELEASFAVPAGWGDIIVALGALALLVLPRKRSLLFCWNCIGTVDILFVVGRAASLRLHNPEALSALTSLPLSLLPTFIVPLIIASHFILFLRLWGRWSRNESTESQPEFAPVS